jgi:EAL domain-containing protein (putative c-di-GMP-specific phosphodiesterase class I)
MKSADALLVAITEHFNMAMEQSKQAPVEESPKDDFQSIYEKIRSALEPAQAHSVSLHDALGEPVWLSEGSLGPDEHRVAQDALTLFLADPARTSAIRDLGASRSAVTLRVASYDLELLGAAMIILDTRAVRQFTDGEHELLSQTMQRALHQYAAIRRAAGDAQAASERAQALQDPGSASMEVDPEIDRLNAALRSNPIELHVQRLVPLHPDAERRRYEVLLRSKSGLMQNAAPRTMLKTAIANGLGSMIDRRVVAELIGWLIRHPSVWQVHSLSFSVNLTRTALHDVNFIKFIDLCLTKAALPRDTLSFEIDIPTALRAKDRMLDIATALHGLGCPLILDDFTSHSECFALMQLPGVAMLKLAADVTARSRTDRVAKTSITALVQRARAQNILLTAKRTKSRADEQWLNELGIDFVQSHAFSLPVTINSLVKRFGTNAAQV